jgi:uncharacterized oxidoreductase
MLSPLAEPSTILLTGATSGIGRALKDQLMAQGHALVTISRNATTDAGAATAYDCDLADSAAVVRVCGEIKRHHHDIGVVINNAAVQHAAPLADTTPAQVVEEAQVNLVAPALIIQSFLPRLLRRAEASAIVNVSSGLAFFPKEATSLYCATKAAIHSLSQSVRYACEGSAVLVTEVILPLVATPMTEGRGRRKLSADDAAHAIIAGLKANRSEVWVDRARLLPVIGCLAPAVGRKMLRRG